jgi:hypothetical protein
MCFVFALGCGGEADVTADDTSALDETDVASMETESDLASVEQAITMPVVLPPGPAQQCISACTRVSTTDITGSCCVCNGAAKKFARGPTASIYLCK